MLVKVLLDTELGVHVGKAANDQRPVVTVVSAAPWRCRPGARSTGVMVIVVGFFWGGGGGPPPPPPQNPAPEPKYSYQQAVEIVGQRIDEVLSQFTPRARFEYRGHGDVPCSGWRDEHGTGQVMYERGGWLDGREPDKNTATLAILKKYWSGNGYTFPIDDSANLKKGWAVVVQDPSGFKIQLIEGNAGRLSLLVQSPCVYPEVRPTGSGK